MNIKEKRQKQLPGNHLCSYEAKYHLVHILNISSSNTLISCTIDIPYVSLRCNNCGKRKKQNISDMYTNKAC